MTAPVDVQPYRRAEQHEAERHGEDEDESRNPPEQVGLLDTRGSERPEAERALPHYNRDQDRENGEARVEEQTLGHKRASYQIIGGGRRIGMQRMDLARAILLTPACHQPF